MKPNTENSSAKVGRPKVSLTPKQLKQLNVLLNSPVKFSRKEIADQLNVSRTSLYRKVQITHVATLIPDVENT